MATCTLLIRAEPTYRVVLTHNPSTRNLPTHRAIYAGTTKDIRCLINEYLSIDDFIALMKVNRAHRQAVSSAIFTGTFWQGLQAKLGYHFDVPSPLNAQTLNQMFEKAYCIAMIPPIISNILDNQNEILERKEKEYLHPIAILKATWTFLKWYHAHDTQTSIYLQNVLFENGYKIFKADARLFHNILKA